MKKLFIGLAFLALMVCSFKAEAQQQPGGCETWTITCTCDGSQHIAIICSKADAIAWGQLLCDC